MKKVKSGFYRFQNKIWVLSNLTIPYILISLQPDSTLITWQSNNLSEDKRFEYLGNRWDNLFTTLQMHTEWNIEVWEEFKKDIINVIVNTIEDSFPRDHPAWRGDGTQLDLTHPSIDQEVDTRVRKMLWKTPWLNEMDAIEILETLYDDVDNEEVLKFTKNVFPNGFRWRDFRRCSLYLAVQNDIKQMIHDKYLS